MDGSGDRLLLLANKHVHMADSLFTMYYASKESRLLLRALEHCRAAIEHAAGSLQDVGDISALDSVGIEGAREAGSLHEQICSLLEAHRAAPAVFQRHGSFVIASESFDSLQEVSAETMMHALRIVKRFVYEAGRCVVMGQVTG